MAAWWSGDVADLLASEPEAIVQRLAVRLVETHHLNRDTQLHAWRQQIVLLRTALRGLPEHLADPVRISAASPGTADRCCPADRARHHRAGIQGRCHVHQRARSPADRGLRARSVRLPRRRAARHPVVPILVATEARPTPHRVAAALARCDAGVRGVGATPGVTAARYCRMCPARRCRLRCARLGDGTISTGADDRRGGDHAVQPAWRR